MATESTGVNLGNVFGPVYWGFVVSLALAGITCLQAYLYFPTSNDYLRVKVIAATMLILDIVSSALVAQSIYYYLLPHFGSLLPLNSVTPELSAECLISTVITLISQSYFVYQLYNVRHLGRFNWLLIGTISICAFLAFAGGVACVTTMYVFKHGVLANRNHTFAIFFGFAKGFGAVTDIIATIAMIVFLRSSRTGMDRTNKLLDTLMQYVIQRGVLVTLIQVLLLITFYAIPSSLVWFAFHVNVTKLYSNTFFAMLNGRDFLKHSNVKSSMGAMHTSSLSRTVRSKAGSERYQLQTIESQATESKSYAMPTVTKTVVISDF